ncbi:MAG TPA: hypothetical protein VFQ00_03350 [Terriglobales bacterium]|nr:hypothetical protein [Terriglobales bacterium]
MIALNGISRLRVWKSGVLRQSGVTLLVLLIAGCGAHANRELVSVMVTPSAADAQNFPSGQVQFVAMGTFSRSPTSAQLNSPDIMWCVESCGGFIAPPGATIDDTGLATCKSGFSGVVTVLAGKPKPQAPMPDVGIQLQPVGTAQLTCP